MSKNEKDNKKTLINVRLDKDDKRALKLQKIFDDWQEKGYYSKVDKVVSDLALLNDMEKITSLRSFLSIYKSSMDFLAPIFNENEEELLYQAMDELFRDAVQNSHISIATRTFEIQAKYIQMKQQKHMSQIQTQNQVAQSTITSQVPSDIPSQKELVEETAPSKSSTAITEKEEVLENNNTNSVVNERLKSITSNISNKSFEDYDFDDDLGAYD